jgi:hypothetical protein
MSGNGVEPFWVTGPEPISSFFTDQDMPMAEGNRLCQYPYDEFDLYTNMEAINPAPINV